MDANYILRWFLDDVPEQSARANELLRKGQAESLRLDRVTIAEVSYVLRTLGYDHKQVYVMLDKLFSYTSIRPATKIDGLALTMYRDTNLDFEDCWLAASASQTGDDLATFDKKLQKLAAALKSQNMANP